MVNFLLSTSTFNFQKNNDVYKKSHNKSVEPTPPPFAIRLFLDSLFILFYLSFYLPYGVAHLRR
jgi:hypothetical protein